MEGEYEPMAIAHMAYSPDGKTLAVMPRGSADRAIWLWRVGDGALLRKVAARSNALAFTPDSSTLVSADQYGDLTLTSIANGKLMRTIDMNGAAPLEAWVSPDGKEIAAYTGRVLYILEADTGETIKEISIVEPVEPSPLPASMSPNWEYFTASATTLEGQYLAVWRIQDGTLIKRWLASKHTPYDLTFAPDSKSIGVATSWETARVWRVP
jgi:WD40 repeat protein